MQKKNKIRSLIALGCVVGLSAAVGAYVSYTLRYDLENPKKGDVVEAVYGIGTVVADQTFVAKTSVPLLVTSVHKVEGADVEAGERIVNLDSGAVLRSPIAGKLTQLLVHKGETVSPNQPLFEVQDLNSRYVRLLLDQESALRVKVDQEVKISVESMRGESYDGVVRYLYPSNGRFVVRVESENLPASILPGMAADLAIEVGRKEDALLIPTSTIREGVVRVLRNEKQVKVPVTIGSVEGSWAEVLDGDITLEDQLVVRRTRR